MLLFFLYKGVKNMLQTSSEECLIKNKILQKQNEDLQIENKKFQDQNRELQEKLAWFKKQIFGKKSERNVDKTEESQYIFPPGWEELFKTEKKVEEKTQIIKEHTRKIKNKGKDKLKFSKDVPIKEVIIDIPENKKVCPITGKPLVKIGEEVSDKLMHIPGSCYIKRIIRPKYALSNGEGIIIADVPASFIPKCRADESTLVEVLIKKFADHLPLYRISEIFERKGIEISRKLLSQWVVRIGLALKPLFDLMIEKIFESENIFIDETELKLLQKKKCKTCYMITMVGGKERDPSYKTYSFKETRSHKNILDLLEGYKGVFHSDKYGAYETFSKKEENVWCPCWVHIRRKFLEAEAGDFKFRNLVIRKIKYLFMFDRIAWNRSPEERVKIRLEKEAPIIDELIKLMIEKAADTNILPKSKLKKAILYFCGLIPHLKNYTKYPWAHLDNNVAERAIRPVVIGRKNWLFVGSEKAGEAAGIILSLVQTCRFLKINPREYLEDVLRRFMGHSFNKLYELLPDQWKKNKNLKKPP